MSSPAAVAARSLTAALAVALLAPLASPSAVQAQHSSRSAATLPSIPQVAVNAGQFKTLLAAVEAAGLTETLLGRGPFTLFAPTDEAFARLPKSAVADLLKPENREQLRTLLTYHVLSGRITAAQAGRARSAKTVAGPSVRVTTENGLLRIDDATVRIADIPASNGVVHVIDRVLMPATELSADAKSAVSLVDFAIERGAPLYNDGKPEATVAVYEVAISALLTLSDSGMSSDVQRTLRNALRDRSDSARDRALALRRVLDDTRRSVSGRMDVSSR